MITQLKTVPANVVAFKATGRVTKQNFENVILPAVNELVQRTGELNYMLILDTPLKNFTLGAWWQDALMGIKQFTKWNRVAIVSESESLNKFTRIFGKLAPGEFKGFTHAEIDTAIHWLSTGQKTLSQEEIKAGKVV
ncbi:MAG TPA: STAS/SEC14 domain-containing protein [Flavobacteriales bacterium]|nr:STAS/SEC14 domain-containing protein [Flavobacteriales bacterium]